MFIFNWCFSYISKGLDVTIVCYSARFTYQERNVEGLWQSPRYVNLEKTLKWKAFLSIPDVYGRRLSEAKPAKEGGCTPSLTTKYEPDTVKTDRDNDVTKRRFLIFCEKCQVGDVTVCGVWVVSTCGFLFPVGHDLNLSTCRWDFFGNAYFRLGECSKIVLTRVCTFFGHFGAGRFLPKPGVGIG